MNESKLSEINGKSVLVDNLCVQCENGCLELQMRCVTDENKSLSIVFGNISKLNLSDISYPFQICGFEIKDYNSCGYGNDSRYFVNDFEDNIISFYCEKIEILN